VLQSDCIDCLVFALVICVRRLDVKLVELWIFQPRQPLSLSAVQCSVGVCGCVRVCEIEK
jgi:hypothetical protein